jgi:hypothetical protein
VLQFLIETFSGNVYIFTSRSSLRQKKNRETVREKYPSRVRSKPSDNNPFITDYLTPRQMKASLQPTTLKRSILLLTPENLSKKTF